MDINDLIAGGGIFMLVIGFVLVWMLFTFIPVRLWIAAMAAGVKVSLGTLIGMRLRKVAPAMVVNPLINATKAGLDLDIGVIEAHVLAGGNVDIQIQPSLRGCGLRPWQRA